MTLPNPRQLRVADHGFVELVGATYDFCDIHTYPGHDATLTRLPETLDAMIARAARTSYAGGTVSVSSDEKLIDRLMRDHHTSPFEMVEFKFLIRAPLFVVQQLLRHRTANVNQESARYSVLRDEVYLPEQLRKQHASNKQMSGEAFETVERDQLAGHIQELQVEAFATYQMLLEAGVSREQARIVLTHGTYTTLVWKCDLHNLLHFLKLRTALDAQPETREYADAMLKLIEAMVPATVASWRNHVQNAVTFSADELEVIKFHFHAWVSRNVGYDETFEESLPEIAQVLINQGIPENRVVAFCHKMELPELTQDHVRKLATPTN